MDVCRGAARDGLLSVTVTKCTYMVGISGKMANDKVGVDVPNKLATQCMHMLIVQSCSLSFVLI